MAVTVLMHMKESPGEPALHLKNGINYVLDVKHGQAKTEYGRWVGGNSGTNNKEIFQTFMETKKFYEKTDGRQGYHFVLSFSPGETTKEVAFKVIQEFCEAFLGDSYDYMYALHTDQEHLHGHIIFNSVSREDGYKYHYKKGDWEKFIQPITDQICKENGLRPLEFHEERVGVSYAEWLHEKTGKVNWTHIIQADIDNCIKRSTSMEEFFVNMKKFGYSMRNGYSNKLQKNYIAFTYVDASGQKHTRRSYKLPPGYSPEEIAERIKTKRDCVMDEKIAVRLEKVVGLRLKDCIIFQGTNSYKRMYQAVSYYKLPNPYAVKSKDVRRDIISINKLIENIEYLKKAPSKNLKDLEKRSKVLDEELKQLYIERKGLLRLKEQITFSLTEEQKENIQMYLKISNELGHLKEIDARYEELEDKLTALATEFPEEFLEIEKKIKYKNSF